MPKLEGSAKQVAWAESIRSKIIDYATRLGKRGDDWGMTAKDGKIAKGVEGHLKAEIASHSDSRWWIDNRDHPAASVNASAIERAFGKNRVSDFLRSNPRSMTTSLWEELGSYGSHKPRK